ncbi:MAG TPA: DMT family transporter [Dongiaceae bacterium]|jgi:drug/metabolite transporter (DMT)-like permease|nr:DMT family transporter [Dongiaceae bacterium]
MESAPRAHGRTRLLAAGALVLGIFVFSVQDVILKDYSATYPLTEAVAIRAVTAILILLYQIKRREGWRSLLPRRSGLLLVRGAIMMVAYGGYYMAFPAMKLAEVVTLFFMAPIFITALAHPFLGERVRLGSWIAVLAGFLGVIITYWPKLFGAEAEHAGGFDWAMLLPVIAALAYAIPQLMARRMAASASASVMGFYQSIMYLLGSLGLAGLFSLGHFDQASLHPSLAFLMRDWVVANWTDILILAACGPISAIGTVLLSQAYRMTEANFVASFEYTGMIWAASWGFLVFGEVPDLYMAAGAVLIVAAGLYMLFYGRKEAA